MADEQLSKTNKFDIHDRIFDFAVWVIKITKALPKTQQNLNIIDQISRLFTSMGANSQEADGLTGRKQIISCFATVKRETKRNKIPVKNCYLNKSRFF